ncbi:MAG: recombinase family protein [Gammaproteobacteria bacterium]|nr:recombinase family protein [Gammaproteobacteria bacterium]
MVIVKLDRFSRSITDLLSIVKEIESKGALLCSLSALVQLILKKCLASIAI